MLYRVYHDVFGGSDEPPDRSTHRTTEVPLAGWVLIALLIVVVAVALNIGAGLIEIPGL